MITGKALRRHIIIPFLVLSLLIIAVSPALAQNDVPFTVDPDPNFTFIPVVPIRDDPPPIPHSDIIEPDYQFNNAPIREESLGAFFSSLFQGTIVEGPGVLQTKTEWSDGIYLYPNSAACNNFNLETGWQGVTWTNHFGGWGAFAADDGYYQAKNVTFDREQVIGPGNEFGPDSASMKIASNQPYDAGVMSPPIPVEPGQEITVKVSYLIFNHNTNGGLNADYASLGVIPGTGEQGQYVLGYQRGEWDVMVQVVEASGPFFQILLQAHSPISVNSNIYFDDVTILIDEEPVTECRW